MIKTAVEVVASWTLVSVPVAWAIGHVLSRLGAPSPAHPAVRHHRIAA